MEDKGVYLDRIKKLYQEYFKINLISFFIVLIIGLAFAFDYGMQYTRKPIIPISGVLIGFFIIYERKALIGGFLACISYYLVIFYSGYFIESIEQVDFFESLALLCINMSVILSAIKIIKIDESISKDVRKLLKFISICFSMFVASSVLKINILGYDFNESIINAMAYMNGNIIFPFIIIGFFKNEDKRLDKNKIGQFIIGIAILYLITATGIFNHNLLRETNVYIIVFFFAWVVFRFNIREMMIYLSILGIISSFKSAGNNILFYRLELITNIYEFQLFLACIAMISLILKVINNEKEESLIKLENSKNQFISYFNLGINGVSIINRNGDFIRVNDKLCEMLGYTKEELLSKNINEVTLKEDLPETLIKKTQLLNGYIDYYEIKKRYVKKNGQIIYVLLGVSGIKDNLGNIIYLAGAISDITQMEMQREELNKINENLEEMAKKRTAQLKSAYEELKLEVLKRELAQEVALRNIKILESGIESVSAGIVVIDIEDLRFKIINSTASEIIEKEKNEIVGKSLNEIDFDFSTNLSEGEVSARNKNSFKKILKDKVKLRNFEMLLKFKDGKKKWVLLNASEIEDNNGNISSLIIVFNEITRRKETEQILIESHRKLSLYADYDEMTQALNRRKGIEVLDQRIKERQDVCIVFIDLDNLKLVNDKYGHGEGDLLIKTTAKLIKSNIGNKDEIIRLGGDEFLIIFQNIKSDQIKKMMESINIELERKSRELKKSYTISISWGLSYYKQGMSVQDFIKEADYNMYVNKKSNKIISFDI